MDHDHLPALSALLFSAPLAVLALGGLELAAARGWQPARVGLERAARAPAAVRLAALLVMMAGAIHLGLAAGHRDEPLLAASFVAAGTGLAGLAAAALLRLPHWRLVTAGALAGVLIAYLVSRLTGAEGVDGLGLATAAVELVALGLVSAGVARGTPVGIASL